ncbi:MAG: DEAD/DEAH box helicase [Flavobacteriales bacterium]
MTFRDLDLSAELLEGIESMNFTKPTPIQAESIPHILQGKDVIGIAQTGTGKTAAFVLPVIDSIIKTRDKHTGTRALIIVPTRELALQIDQAVEAYSYFTGVSSVAIYGGGDGNDFNNEKRAITSGVEIIVATPGRLISHMNVGYVDFSKLDFFILDEADRMLDMGFAPDLNRIIRTLNTDRQSLLFSATMPDTVFRLAKSILKDPITVNIALSKPSAGIKQAAIVLHDHQKPKVIEWLLNERKDISTIIFSSTKQNVQNVFAVLKKNGLNVGMISSDLEQQERERVMLDFRAKRILVLVATDVVSRGIDIDIIDCVVNYDVPGDAEDYVHRIGRTARAERKGEAFTLIGNTEHGKFGRIETLIGQEVEKISIPLEFGEVPAYQPIGAREPRHGGGGGGGKKPFHRSKSSGQKSKGGQRR